MPKKMLMLAGPNGAGKTTLARELISNSSFLYEFINADEIAKGLAPNHPESVSLMASKLMITRLKELLEDQKSFAFESTLSGTNYLKHLKAAKAQGYDILLFFLWLETAEQAVKRVEQRVKQGGHFVPENIIHRRYDAGLKNLLKVYLKEVDIAVMINNTVETSGSKMIAVKNNEEFDIIDQGVWEKIQKAVYG